MQEKLFDKLIEKCTKTVEEVKLAKMTSTELHLAEHENKYKCSSCTLYIVLFSIIFTVKVEIGSYFLYFRWYSEKDVARVKFGTRTQTTL